MPFQQLKNTKLRHPRLRQSLDELGNYIRRELNEGRTRIVPALAARGIGKSEAETLALLMLFEDAKVLIHEYDIVCTRNNVVLKTVSNLSELEDTLRIHCQLCDTDHGPDDLRTELVFEVIPTIVQAPQHHAYA